MRLGLINMQDEEIGPVRRAFVKKEVGPLSLNQIVWWDETHRMCVIGMGSKVFVLKFLRDKTGKLDCDGGEYSSKKCTHLNVKYEKEARFGLGCATVQPLDHNGVKLAREGRRCDPFDYSTKLLITIDDFNKYIEQEFRRVKSTSDNSKYWITVSREVGKLYADDKLDRLWMMT